MEWFYSIDVNILTYVQEFLRTASLTYFFEEITDLGNNGWFWIVLGCILTAIKRTRIPGILMLAALIVSGAVDNMVLKTVVDRTRPFLADPSIQNLVTAHGSSFPSGHTGSSFAAAGVMWRTMPRKYGFISHYLGCFNRYLSCLFGRALPQRRFRRGFHRLAHCYDCRQIVPLYAKQNFRTMISV
jgi:membrane-associated phospholipid phosphatase